MGCTYELFQYLYTLHTALPPSPPLHTEPPLLWDGPHDVTAASGSKVTLRCRYSGVPTPSIYWYHEDALVAPGDRVCLSAKDGFVSLHIPCLEASAAGEYTCTAVNSVGTVTTHALISVQGELGISTHVCSRCLQCGYVCTYVRMYVRTYMYLQTQYM